MLNIECAELLSSKHQFEFIDEIFNYRNVQSLSVKGRIVPTGLTPTTDIYARLATLLNGANDYEPITVNNVNLGTGRIISVAADAGLDVLSKKYSFEIELYKTGNLYNLTGDFYDGVDMQTLSLSGAQYLKGISENFSFNDNGNETYSYSRSLSMELDGGISSNPSAYAKGIADIFFLNSPELAIINANYPSFYQADGFKKRQESYDIINYKYAFEEDFTSAGSEDAYAWTYETQISFGGKATTVSENGEIQGLKTNPYSYALDGFQDDIETGIYLRCNNAYQSWSTLLGDTTGECSLTPFPVSKGVQFNRYAGLVSYNYDYSTQSGRESCKTREYTTSVSRDSNGVFNVSEKGSLCYICNVAGESDSAYIIDEDTEYIIDEDAENLLYTYNDIIQFGSGKLDQILAEVISDDFRAAIDARVYGVYTRSFSNTGIPCKTARDLNVVSFSKEFSEKDGCFSYNFDYNDDPTVSSTGNFIKQEFSQSTDFPVHLVNKFNIPNFKEVVQPSDQSTLGTISNQIVIIGRKTQTLSQLVDRALTFVEKPTDDLAHIVDAKYSWNPESNILNFSVDYSYSEYRPFTNVLAW